MVVYLFILKGRNFTVIFNVPIVCWPLILIVICEGCWKQVQQSVVLRGFVMMTMKISLQTVDFILILLFIRWNETDYQYDSLGRISQVATHHWTIYLIWHADKETSWTELYKGLSDADRVGYRNKIDDLIYSNSWSKIWNINKSNKRML